MPSEEDLKVKHSILMVTAIQQMSKDRSDLYWTERGILWSIDMVAET